MIILDNIGHYRKGRIWLNSHPNIQYDTATILQTKIFEVTDEQWVKKTTCLEMLLPINVSNYGLLGIEFIPQPTDYIELSVYVGKDNEQLFIDSLAQLNDNVYVGLPKQYAETIFKLAQEILQQRILPPGKLKINVAAHAEIGSSRFIFSLITRIIFKIVVYEITTLVKEDIERIVVEEMNKTDISNKKDMR
jgi:hypothetical protein